MDQFLDEYLEQFSIISLSTTLLLSIFWVFLFLLMCHVLIRITCKQQELHPLVKLFSITSTISFLLYISFIIAAMIFYQFKRKKKYIYSIVIAYIIFAFAKHAMYFLYLQTLYNTFQHTKFGLSLISYRFITSLIIMNSIVCLIQTYFWYQHQFDNDSLHIWYMTLATIPTEILYSLLIIGLFGRRLFILNVTRVNDQKTRKYENRVRSATFDIVSQQKEKIYQMKRSRSTDYFNVAAMNNHHPQSPLSTDLEEDALPTTPRSMSLSPSPCSSPRHSGSNTTLRIDIPIASGTETVTVNSASSIISSTPTVKARKSMINIRAFNKANKELLDQHQLSMIATATKYTVLSSVAFISSLSFTAITGGLQLLYHSSYDWQKPHKLDFLMISLFIMGFNAVISDVCVLLIFSFNKKLYRFLCCFCRFFCTGCFTYCSIRHIMVEVEDKLAEEIDTEFKAMSRDSGTVQMEEHANDHENVEITSLGTLSIKNNDSDTHTISMPIAPIPRNSHSKIIQFPDGNTLRPTPSDSHHSTSITPTPYKMNNHELLPGIPERDNDDMKTKEDIKRQSSSRNIKTVTVTSPDNEDIVVMHKEAAKEIVSAPQNITWKLNFEPMSAGRIRMRSLSSSDREVSNSAEDTKHEAKSSVVKILESDLTDHEDMEPDECEYELSISKSTAL